MTLGDILKQAAQKDLSAPTKTGLSYTELTVDGKFEIKLSTPADREAFIECSVADMKRLKQVKKNKK